MRRREPSSGRFPPPASGPGPAPAPATFPEPARRSAPRASGDAANDIIAALAGRQHGVVARWQLLLAGISLPMIESRVKRRRLLPIHRGVYRVGPVIAPLAPDIAAVLACGEAALLSHDSATVAWRLLDASARAAGSAVHVTSPRSTSASGTGIRLHRVTRVPADEATVLDGIPITSPARTLLDLAGCREPADVERALLEALRRRLVNRASLAAILERYPRRKGTRLIRDLLAHCDDPQLTRSEAERALRRLVREARIRQPQLNVRVEGYEVDAHWPDERLVVEVDGFATHSSSAAFERDRRRDADFAAAGVTVIRFTWRQLTREPLAVVARLAAALATARERLAAQRR